MTLQLTDHFLVNRSGTDYIETWENIEDGIELNFDIAGINNNILDMSTNGIGIGLDPSTQLAPQDFSTLTELP